MKGQLSAPSHHPLPPELRRDGAAVELSVVVPVYGCAGCLVALHRRLVAGLSSVGTSFEIVFVDDRSPDGAWEVLKELSRLDSNVRAVRLSRNFGQAAAITAGLSLSRGRWTIVMDCDLEEPPEEIPRLYAKALEGYDVVQGVRGGWTHSRLRRLASRLYRFLVMDAEQKASLATLSILSRKVVDAYLRLQDSAREYVLLVDWLGFEQATIEFEHGERPSGASAYTLGRLLRTGLDGVFFRTTALLRFVVLLGFVIAICGIGLAGWDTYSHFTTHTPAGYTSLVVLMLVLVGFVIVSVGVVGLYVGRIFNQVKARPIFILDEEAPSANETAPRGFRLS